MIDRSIRDPAVHTGGRLPADAQGRQRIAGVSVAGEMCPPVAGARLRRMAAAAIAAVTPDRLVRRAVTRHGDSVTVAGRRYRLAGNVYVVGAGKAVLAMLAAAERLLRPHVVRGVLSVPVGARDGLPAAPAQVEICEGAADNLPDEAAAETAAKIASLAASLTADDLLVVLISGGGSALLPAPRAPLTLPAKTAITASLASQGASIQELNTVRRRLSRLKGGGLARLAAPAPTLALVLSDVIGDPLHLIASGPTYVADQSESTDGYSHQSQPAAEHPHQSQPAAPDSHQSDPVAERSHQSQPTDERSHQSEPAAERSHQSEATTSVQDPSVTSNPTWDNSSDAAAAVLAKYGLLDDLTRETLAAAERELSAAAVRPDSNTVLIGSNRLALEAMLADAGDSHHAVLLSSRVCGDCDQVARLLAQLTAALLHTMSGDPSRRPPPTVPVQQLQSIGICAARVEALQRGVRAARAGAADRRPLCLLLGGETTVRVRGAGRGGRCQQLCLAFALQLERLGVPAGYRVQLLSCGTDGIDGPTDAAGALVDGATAAAARAQRLDPDRYLRDNDSYGFFQAFDGGSHHIKIGHTGTNVMDVMALVISPPPPGEVSKM